MSIKDFKITAKLAAGFFLVIAIFVGVTVFQIFSLSSLGELQDEVAGRASDAVEIQTIAKRVDAVYAVIADSIINRNLEESKRDFAEVKKITMADIKRVHELVDTEEERGWAKDFETGFMSYLGLFENKMLPILEKEESIAQRMSDSLEIMKIELRVEEVYPVIADGIINRNLAETKKDWNDIKNTVENDIRQVAQLSDTDKERQLADRFATSYRKYLDLFESETIPLLSQDTTKNWNAIRDMDEKMDQARVSTLKALHEINLSLEAETLSVMDDEKSIRELDGAIDEVRDNTIKPLGKIAESLRGEQAEADELFGVTASSTRLWSIIVCIVAVLLGLIVAITISLDITRPIAQLVTVAREMANGNMQQSIDIQRKDEVGILAGAFKQMSGSLKTAVMVIQRTMNSVSQGDLTNRIDEAGMKGDLSLIKDSINNSIDMLSNTITQVVTATDQVNSGAGQISSASQSLASGTTEQAASLEEISSSMSEVGSRSNANNDSANQAAQLTTQTMEIANRGNEQMKEMLASMDNINSSSADISKIIKVIDEIAFQTNLLALNAAVEAARAGKYGKGFAVVAEEVRNLAARSAEAAKNTTELIENSVKEVDSGVSNAGKTADVLTEISDSITKVNDLVGEIASSSQEQSNSTDEINKSLVQVNDVVQQNSSISEEAASASEELSGQAMELQGLMARFQLIQTDAFQKTLPAEQAAFEQPVLENKGPKPAKMITLDDDNFGKY
jgi:methyl-accepting chemotaxis protein